MGSAPLRSPSLWLTEFCTLCDMDSRLAVGVSQFNAGQFFVAHEVWEALWDDTVGPGKMLLRGLVQIAAGYAKVESGLGSGALKLLTRGVEHVREFLPASLGLDLVGLVNGVTADIARLRAAPDDGVSLAAVQPPQVQLL